MSAECSVREAHDECRGREGVHMSECMCMRCVRREQHAWSPLKADLVGVESSAGAFSSVTISGECDN